MAVAIVTGSSGLIGSEATRYFAQQGFDLVGIDNDMRKRFFGDEASTTWQREQLEAELGSRLTHENTDIRDETAINELFARYGNDIKLIIHTAAQPSHDWAAREPLTDFSVNAVGTLNLLEATRQHSPEAVFIFTSTNKVYGDTPNRLPLVELDSRWEIEPGHAYEDGISEDMSIDQTLHSLFGASKVAADVLVQEYGRYFDMRTACFRGGCLTGPNHSGTQLHGFLAYLMKCAATGTPYQVFGYKGKQVRDNIHSNDLIQAFDQFYQAPRCGEVYNIGGGRFSNCSMAEAITLCEEITGNTMDVTYQDGNRTGDHIWWISDVAKFANHYPGWDQKYDVPAILNRNLRRQPGTLEQEPGDTMIDCGKKNLLGVGIDGVDYDAAVSPRDPGGKGRKTLRRVGTRRSRLDDRSHGSRPPISAEQVRSVDAGWSAGSLGFELVVSLPSARSGLRAQFDAEGLCRCGRRGPANLPVRRHRRNAGRAHAASDGKVPQVANRRHPNRPGFARRHLRNATSWSRRSKIRAQRSPSWGSVARGRKSSPTSIANGWGMPLLAVGAAFAFHAGQLEQAPAFFQDRGLEWLFRLTREPKRLWRRYVLLNPLYLSLLAGQFIGVYRPSLDSGTKPTQEVLYG